MMRLMLSALFFTNMFTSTTGTPYEHVSVSVFTSAVGEMMAEISLDAIAGAQYSLGFGQHRSFVCVRPSAA